MPTVTVSHFFLDLPTLLVVTMFVSATGGLLLIFAWLQNRNTPALGLWGVGYLMAATASALLTSPASMAQAWPACLGNALLCGAYGLMWSGARSFEGRRVSVPLLAVGAAIWVVAFQFESFAQSILARLSLVAAISGTYALLAAAELWNARDRDLLSRWPTLILVVGHAGFLLSRIPLASVLAASAASGQAHGPAASIMAFETLFVAVCMPFLRVAMSKERAEQEQRKAALTDPLTGIANRRAFFDYGSRLLELAIAERRSAALLLFDLDRFKEINDTAGHQAGDRVLQAFCDLVGGSMRPGDLFGRLGGEEFACLLTNTSIAHALHVAERLRCDFATTSLAELAVRPTVSVGVAMVSEAGATLSALLATADRALYRAKADGRNRVARAPLVLVDNGDGEAVRRTIAISAPAAG